MIRIFVAIFFSFLFVLPAFSQRKKKKKKEETFVEQAKDDVFAITSSEQFSYLDKFHLAVREKLSGNLSEAKRLFLECVEEYPNNDAVYFALAEIAKKQKLKSEALRFLLEAQRLDPNNIFYTQEIAFLQLDKAQFEEAVVNFEQLVEREPRHVEWIYAYGQALVYSGKYKDAIGAFEKVQDIMGPIPEITMMLVELYKETKQEDEIEGLLLKLKKAFPQDLSVLKTVIGYYEESNENEKAIKLIEELVIAEPENGIAHFILASYYGEKKNDEKLFYHLPIVMKSSDVPLGEKLSLLRLTTVNSPNDEEIEKLFELLIEEHENDLQVHSLYGDYLVGKGKPHEALVSYKIALNNEPNEFGVWATILAFQSAYKFYDALYIDAQKALEIFPTMPFAYYAAAEGAIKAGKLDEARSFLDMGEAYVLDDKKQQSRFAMRRGEIFFAQGDSKKGKEQMEKALKLQPNSEPILVSYANNLVRFDKDYKSSEKLLYPLLKNESVGSNVYYALGNIYLQSKDYTKGIRLIETALEEVNFKAELFDLLGDLYFHNEELNKAVEAWEKAKQNQSNNRELDKKLEEKMYYAPIYF